MTVAEAERHTVGGLDVEARFSLQDGPAADQDGERYIRRCPSFLRVVIAADGTVDCLDQLDDKPREGEALHVYRLVALVHVCRSGDATGWWATYVHVEPSSPVELKLLGDRSRWQQWVENEADRRDMG